MEQLSGLDTAFVHQDSRRTPMHVTAVLLYDIGKDETGTITGAFLRRLVAKKLRRFPVFYRKLHRVPMDMDAPYWVDVPAPDLDYHISSEAIEPGGGWPEVELLLTDLHRRGLNLAKPLWEICLVRGLSELPGLPLKCQALVLKVHHAAIDGASLARLIDAIHEETVPRARGRTRARRAPDYWDIWARLNRNSIGRQFKFAETVGNLIPGVLRSRQTRKRFGDLPGVLTTRAHFNDRVGGGRTVGAVIWPREELIAIKRAVRHVTLNDIALSIVSGALRKYLARYHRLPGRSLVAGVPINLRHPASEAAGGNRIATMMVGLASTTDNPVQRLRLVHRYAVAGKKRIDALGTGTVMDISDSVSPNILAGGIRAMAQASLMVLAPVPFHTMVSHVPGPSAPLRLGKAELVVPLGFGPVRDNMGLFHIVSSSSSKVSLSFSACDRLLPDGEFYKQCLQRAFTALFEDATGQQIPGVHR